MTWRLVMLLVVALGGVALASADVPEITVAGQVGGGAVGGAVTTAAMLGLQSLLAWLRQTRAEDQAKAATSAQVQEARARAAADASLAARVQALEAGRSEILALLAGKADADDLARVERVVTHEAAAAAKFREALAGRLGELQGEVRTALAAAGRSNS